MTSATIARTAGRGRQREQVQPQRGAAVGAALQRHRAADEHDAEHERGDEVDRRRARRRRTAAASPRRAAACRAGSGGASRPRRGRPAASARRPSRTRPSSAARAPRSAAASRRRRSRRGRSRRPLSPPVTAAQPTSGGTAPAAPPHDDVLQRAALEPHRVDAACSRRSRKRQRAASRLTVSASHANASGRARAERIARRAADAPRGHRARRRARHLRVDVAVVPVVDRPGAAGGQVAADAGGDDQPDRRVPGDEHRRHRGQQQQRLDLRLGQREQVGDQLPEPRGAAGSAMAREASMAKRAYRRLWPSPGRRPASMAVM